MKISKLQAYSEICPKCKNVNYPDVSEESREFYEINYILTYKCECGHQYYYNVLEDA